MALTLPLYSLAQSKSFEFEAAVANGTRTETGKPGANYKNNFVEYKINVSFDPDSQMLEGDETVTFHYNMPSADLNAVYFNLYRNVYKKGIIRHRNCNPEDISDEGMEILDVSIVDGSSELGTRFRVNNTKLIVSLDQALSSGNSVTFRVKWRNSIAAVTHHRGGRYYNNSWFVPYWYPQIAVYDDLYGWDTVDHSISEEFLQEFANYDVTIHLGNRMMVWATGKLENPNLIFTPAFMTKYKKAITSDALVTLFAPGGSASALKKDVNDWHFKADSVPDFVFACSNEMGWTGFSTPIRAGKPRTFVSAVYHSNGFGTAASTATRKTLEYLSTVRPGVPYPYEHMTVFQGSGGMEFPMMINEDFDMYFDSDFFTTSHEVTHSYFPFITGMYQNRYAFMDEGLAQYVPQYFQNENFKNKDIIHEACRYLAITMGSDQNVPMATPSYSQTNSTVYTINSYYKPQVMYTVLEDIVGKETMTQILRELVQTWRGKHPHPFDFFNLCSTVSGKDLKEFFRSWAYSYDYSDLAIVSVDGSKITIRNVGGLMVPIDLSIVFDDDSSAQEHRDALIWSDGKKEVTIEAGKPVRTVVLGNEWFPDADASNNSN